MTSEKYGEFAAAIGVTAAFVKRCVAATTHTGSKLSERREAKRRLLGLISGDLNHLSRFSIPRTMLAADGLIGGRTRAVAKPLL